MPSIWEYREVLEQALAYSGGTHSFEDVRQMVSDQRAQLWTNRGSVAVTEVLTFPQKKVLHCFLAAGKRDDLLEMMPYAAQWGHMAGCTGFTIAGRKGWQRVLSKYGWRTTMTVMEIAPQECYSAANLKEVSNG